MPRFITLLILIFISFALPAQVVKDNSVSWDLNTDNNLITLRYKLSKVKKGKTYLGVFVQAKSKNELIPIKIAQGDIGRGVDSDASKEKEIIFDPAANKIDDIGNLSFTFDVFALPAKYDGQGAKLTAPRKAIPSLAITGLGAGLGFFSYAVYKDSRDIYRIYESEPNPLAPVYQNGLNRDDYFDTANTKYRNAQILALGSAALLATGISSWVKYKIRKDNWGKMQWLSLSPGMWNEDPVFQYASNSTPWGMTLTVNLQNIN